MQNPTRQAQSFTKLEQLQIMKGREWQRYNIQITRSLDVEGGGQRCSPI